MKCCPSGSRAVCFGALWLGIMTHIDWHLGRPGHDHLSFHLSYHWLLALPAFLPLAWLAGTRWPNVAGRAGMRMILLGLLIGQVLEPLGEALLGEGLEPFTNTTRWRVFAEFLAAGLLTFFLGLMVVRYIARERRFQWPG